MINYLYSSQSNILTPLNTIYWLNALFVLSRLLFYKINKRDYFQMRQHIMVTVFNLNMSTKLFLQLTFLLWSEQIVDYQWLKATSVWLHMSANSSVWACMLTKAWLTKPIISNTHRLNMRDRLMTRKADWPSPALSGSGSGVEWRGLRSHQCPAGSLYWETHASQSRKTQFLIYGNANLWTRLTPGGRSPGWSWALTASAPVRRS